MEKIVCGVCEGDKKLETAIIEHLKKEGFNTLENFKGLDKDELKDILKGDGITTRIQMAIIKAIQSGGVKISPAKKVYPHKPPLYSQLVSPNNEKELEFRKFLSDDEVRGFNDIIAKTVIMIGETGSGKSTLIEAMCNFLLDIKFNDKFRYKMVNDPQTKSTLSSQTAQTTTYKMIDYKIGYMVKLIDTPGFGDTRGIKADIENKNNIHEFLKTLSRIDAICFVAKSNETRLTDTQKYIIREIQTIFGKDAEENIAMMLNFADGGVPQTTKAMAEEKVPFKQYYKFNNSALFAQPYDADKITELYWEIGQESMGNFFESLRNAKGFSLTMTKEVIKERERLNCIMEGFMPKLENKLLVSRQLKETIADIELHKDSINKNQNYEETVQEEDIVTTNCVSGGFTTYCENCHITCHRECAIKKKEDKKGCNAMNGEYCLICPGKCHYMQHLHYEKIIERQMVAKKRINTSMKYQLDKAIEGKKLSDLLVEERKNELSSLENEINKDVEHLKECKVKLSKIALKDYNMSTCAYIQLLIQNTINNSTPGYEKRLEELRELLKKKQTEESVFVSNEIHPGEEIKKQ